jgi:hypothetical protein
MDLSTDPLDESLIAQEIEEFKEIYPKYYSKKPVTVPEENELVSDGLSDEEDAILLPSLNPIQVEDLSQTELGKFQIALPVPSKNRRRSKLGPVIPNEPLPNIEGFAFLPYKSLLKRELSESEEMYETRTKIADLLSELKFEAADYDYAKLDSLSILNYSRMINDHIWYGVMYSKKYQSIIEKLMTLIEM